MLLLDSFGEQVAMLACVHVTSGQFLRAGKHARECACGLVNKLSVSNAQSEFFNTELVLFLLETMLMLNAIVAQGSRSRLKTQSAFWQHMRKAMCWKMR